MSQDNKKSMVMYQGDGSNNVFAVPMTKGKYGTISVAFVRRGLDNYEYNPTTWTLNGGLFAWADTSGSNFYTNTDIPAVGATVYNQYGVDTGYTVSAVNGTTITITDEGSSVLSRNSAGDVDENTLLTWTGDVLNVGDYIVIERTTVRKQPYEFPNNQKHIERSDDNLERQIQEVADAADRALKLDPTYSIDSGKMNPVDWLQTILRSRDLSVRELRFIDGQLCYSTVDPESAEAEKTWTPVPNAFGFTSFRYVEQEVDGIKYRWIEAQKDGAWFPVAGGTPMRDGTQSETIKEIEWRDDNLILTVADIGEITISGLAGYDTRITTNAQSIQNLRDTKVNRAGDTMTGALTLPGTASGALHAVPKQQLDAAVALRASKSSDFTNPITGTTKGLTTQDKLELQQEIEDAKLSGTPLGDGFWFAKTNASTVVPTPNELITQLEIEISDPSVLNYIDLSGSAPYQGYTATADGTGWTASETITPPDSRVYIEITKKFLDIAETNNVGGQADWHNDELKWVPVPKFPTLSGVMIYDENGIELGSAEELQGVLSLSGKRAIINLPSNVITTPSTVDLDGEQDIKSLSIQQSESPLDVGDDLPEGETVIVGDNDSDNPDWYLNFVNGMPSNTRVNLLNLTASGQQFTAPDDGWFLLSLVNATGYALIRNLSGNGLLTISNGANSGAKAVYMPVKAGTVVTFQYASGSTSVQAKFIYADKTIEARHTQVRWPVIVSPRGSAITYTVYNDGYVRQFGTQDVGGVHTFAIPMDVSSPYDVQCECITYSEGVGTIGSNYRNPISTSVEIYTRWNGGNNTMTHKWAVEGYGDLTWLHNNYPDLF